MKKLFLLIGFGIYLSGTAFSQSVAWTDPGQIPPQSGVQLDLVFTDCQPKGNVNLPSMSELQFSGSPGRATSYSMINFQTSSSTTLSYVVQASQNGRILIPSFEVVTDKGRMTVPSLALDVTAAAGNRARQPNPLSPNFPFPPNPFQNQAPNPGSQVVPPDAVQASAQAEPRRPYIGEVFDVNYRVVMTGNRSGRVKTTPLWDVQNFTAEAWDRGQQIGPGGNQGLQFHTRAMVPKAGLFELPSIRQKLDIDTAAGGRSFFFTAPGSVEVEAVAAPVPLNVEALPANVPAGFKGAVGQFVLESKLVPEQVGEGEPVTWTLTLRGTGNWPMGVELPARAVPKEIRTIQPKLRREFNGTDLFTGAIVEDLVMIPTKSGEYELPAVKFLYFDPKKKAFEILEAKPPKISVTRGAGGLALTPPSVGASASSGQIEKKAGVNVSGKKNKLLEYGLPGLPKEPLEGRGYGFGPLPVWLVVAVALMPWAILIWVWWGWVKMRAVNTDPRSAQKDALEEWKNCVQKISNAKSKEEIVRPLILWQQAVFKFLGIKTAAPRAGEIKKVKTEILKQESLDGLYKTYRIVEDALYGIETGVRIGDWCDETKKIAAEAKFPPQRWTDVLAPKNVWPWISLLMVCLGADLVAKDTAGSAAPTPADNPIGLYREGSFKKAEQIWAATVGKNMRDPVSRNNLALAYYQMGDKERALAYGLSAYLLSPETTTVAWNTRIFAQGADQLDGAVLALWDDQGAAWLTSRFGVFGWQGILVLGIAACALGAGLGLASGYFEKKRRIFFRVGAGTLMVGLLGVGGGSSALGIYGKLADRDAVMIVDVEPLRSIPTEVEPQAEKKYPPGSIARLEKSFLGWSKIRLPNQDAGWIRSEHIVSLY